VVRKTVQQVISRYVSRLCKGTAIFGIFAWEFQAIGWGGKEPQDQVITDSGIKRVGWMDVHGGSGLFHRIDDL